MFARFLRAVDEAHIDLIEVTLAAAVMVSSVAGFGIVCTLEASAAYV